MERIDLDKAYRMNVVHALNDLTFIKAKDKYLAETMKNEYTLIYGFRERKIQSYWTFFQKIADILGVLLMKKCIMADTNIL